MTCPRPQKSLGQSRTRRRVFTSGRAPDQAHSPPCHLRRPVLSGIEPGSPGIADRTRQCGRGRMGAGSPRGAAHSLSDPYGGGGGDRCLRGDRAGPPGGC